MKKRTKQAKQAKQASSTPQWKEEPIDPKKPDKGRLYTIKHGQLSVVVKHYPGAFASAYSASGPGFTVEEYPFFSMMCSEQAKLWALMALERKLSQAQASVAAMRDRAPILTSTYNHDKVQDGAKTYTVGPSDSSYGDAHALLDCLLKRPKSQRPPKGALIRVCASTLTIVPEKTEVVK
jgi:hypothetical protein